MRCMHAALNEGRPLLILPEYCWQGFTTEDTALTA